MNEKTKAKSSQKHKKKRLRKNDESTVIKKDKSCNRDELEVKVRRRVAWEKKAFRIVERLVEETVSPEILTTLAQHIDPSHYADITEERFLADLCGYPVCGNHVGKVLSQKYHISTRSNRVYDITERKKFCSNQCYNASKYFGEQISSSPVWLREEERPVKFTLLPQDICSNKGSAGENIIFPPSHEIQRDLNQLEDIDKRNERSQQRLKKVLKHASGGNKGGESETVLKGASGKEKGGDNMTVDTVANQLAETYIQMTNQNDQKDVTDKKTDEICDEGVKSDNLNERAHKGDFTDVTKPLTVEIDDGIISMVEVPDTATKVKVQTNTEHPNLEINSALSERISEEVLKVQGEHETCSALAKGETTLQADFVDQSLPGLCTNSEVDKNPDMSRVDYSIAHQSRRKVYGLDHVQQINKMELCKEIVQRELPPQKPYTEQMLSDALKGTKDFSEKSRQVAKMDYPFEYQSREIVYGLDHDQQIRKMEANKELLLTELREKSAAPELDRQQEVQIPDVSNNADHNSNASLTDAVQNKGQLLVQLLNKRDALKRQELNESQNTVFETKRVISEENLSERYSGVLQNVKRASQQHYNVSTNQTKENELDSDDDVDDVANNSVNIMDQSNVINPESRSNESETEKTIHKGPTCKQKIDDSSQTSHKPRLSPFKFVQNILFEWKTVESVKFLRESSQTAKSDTDFESKFAAFGRKIDHKYGDSSDLIDEIDSDDDPSIPVGRLPDMRTLGENTEPYTVKVRDFLFAKTDPDSELGEKSTVKAEGAVSGGQDSGKEAAKSHVIERELDMTCGVEEEDPKARRFRKKNFPMKEDTEGRYNRENFITEPDVILPRVDSKAQISIRRKIVLDKLSTVLPELLLPLRLTLADVSPHLRPLVYSFNLTSKNVSLKPAEWTLMCLMLLKLLSTKVKRISSGFELLSARTYFDTLTHSIGLTEGQINHIVRKFLS